MAVRRKPAKGAAQAAPVVTRKRATRRFWLWRKDDPSGVSGTGRVAEGVEFPDGWCALSWGDTGVGVYPSLKDIEKVHGHQGKTQVMMVDD